ncbi:MAG: hypothetical protein ACR2NR_15300 [Solirubrobacteraceae bacterium]
MTPESGEGEFKQVRLPDASVGDAVEQDEEWFDVFVGGEQRRIRFHDYGAIYDVPGLYEHLFYDELECVSPQTVVGLLNRELSSAGSDPASLVALDVGAGNGMVGEELRRLGVASIVGVDLLPEASAARSAIDRRSMTIISSLT